MLIARAPMRISLAGGGTDIEAYYLRYGGMVISTTIDKYFYAFLNVGEEGRVQISSSDYRTFCQPEADSAFSTEGELALPRAILHHFGVEQSISLFLASEIPPGTGLGSSSAAAVAIIKALAVASEKTLSKSELAEIAAYIEIIKLGTPIGKQDQYAAAFGGFNLLVFEKDQVSITPLNLSRETVQQLQRNLMLFFMGTSRESASILKEQTEACVRESERVIEALHSVKKLVHEVKECLESGHPHRLGDIFHRSWMEKRQFAKGVSNSLIDECYETALSRGARGGKITGAGGGGFMMLYCEEEHQDAVTKALAERGIRPLDFRFETGGAKILLNTGLPLRQNMKGQAAWNNHDAWFARH